MKNYLLAASMILKTETLDFEDRASDIEDKTGVPGEFVLSCLEDMRFDIMARWEGCAKDAQAVVQKLREESRK